MSDVNPIQRAAPEDRLDLGGLSQKELAAARLSARLELYQSIARSAGFSLELGDKTCFNHNTSTVLINPDQLLEMNISTPEEIDFIVLHELGHYKELYDDPKGYAEVIKEGERDDGLGEVYFRLYNALMDIYVNTNTSNRASLYTSSKFRGENGEYFSDAVRSLYSDKTFAERDFSTRPFCIQYADYLLNLGMEAAEDVKLSPEVQKEIDQGITDLSGKNLSYKELINRYLRPVLTGKATKDWSASISQRKMIIDLYIRPVFEKLLKNDLQNGRTRDLESDDSDLEVAKEVLKDALKKEIEKNLTQREKQNKERQNQVHEILRNSGLNPKEVQDFMQAYARMYPTILELADLWQRIRQKDISFSPEDRGFFPKGHRLDIQKTIQEFPGISSGSDSSRIMYKRVFDEVVRYNPKKLWLTIVPDMSGSMDQDMEKVRDLCVALAGSFSIINQQQDSLGQEGLRCELSVIGFDDQIHPLLTKSDNTQLVDVAKIYAKLQALGGTSDHLALDYYLKLVSDDIQESINSGEIFPIVIEITDGDTSAPAESRKLINQINRLGIRVQGIRFGSGLRPDEKDDFQGPKRYRKLSPEEEKEKLLELEKRSETFDQIWNSDGKIKGHKVWSAKGVVPKVYELLEDFLDER